MRSQDENYIFNTYIKEGGDFTLCIDDVLCEEIKIKYIPDEQIKSELLIEEKIAASDPDDDANSNVWIDIFTYELSKRRRIKLMKIKDKINENTIRNIN